MKAEIPTTPLKHILLSKSKDHNYRVIGSVFQSCVFYNDAGTFVKKNLFHSVMWNQKVINLLDQRFWIEVETEVKMRKNNGAEV